MLSDGKNTFQAKQSLDKSYLDSAQSETTVKMWYADFKRGCTNTNDAERSGHPNSAVVLENTKKLHHKFKLWEIAEKLKILEGSVFTILHERLSMRKLCSKPIKNNNASMIQSIVCNCFNATKGDFV